MNKIVFTIGIVFTLGFSSFAQNGGNSASAGGRGSGSIEANQAISIEGQLEKTLDVKNARVGDEFVIKTTRAIKNAGTTIVPKGSRLIGRITEVQQRTKGNDVSRLGFVFDRIEGKNLNSNLSGSLITITNIAATSSVIEPVNLFGSSNASTSTSAGSSRGSSGGGLLGGAGSAAGGLVGGVTNTVGNTLNSGLQTVGRTTGAVDQTVGSATGHVFRTVDGLHISNSAEGSAQSSTSLSAAGKNLKVEKGAAVKLQLIGDVNGQ